MQRICFLSNSHEGSWFPHLLVEGLIKHPRVDAAFNHALHVFGQPLAEAHPNFPLALQQADLIWRVGAPHLGITQYDAQFDAENLWAKTVYFDLTDEGPTNHTMRQRCLRYVSRRWPDAEGMLRLGYGIVDAFLMDLTPTKVTHRPRRGMFAFNPDAIATAYNCEARRALLQELRARPHLGVSFGRTTAHWPDDRKVDPRRAYREPVEGNPVVEYLRQLRRTRIVYTAPPDHGNGDGRTWEAFASRTLVVADESINEGLRQPFVDGRHCLLFDYNDVGSIRHALDRAASLIDDSKARGRIARCGHAYARRHHSAVHRVETVLRALGVPRCPKKLLLF